jgi:dimeric dUTPase (all-alpha-NTP-PPase superfamily)
MADKVFKDLGSVLNLGKETGKFGRRSKTSESLKDLALPSLSRRIQIILSCSPYCTTLYIGLNIAQNYCGRTIQRSMTILCRTTVVEQYKEVWQYCAELLWSSNTKKYDNIVQNYCGRAIQKSMTILCRTTVVEQYKEVWQYCAELLWSSNTKKYDNIVQNYCDRAIQRSMTILCRTTVVEQYKEVWQYSAELLWSSNTKIYDNIVLQMPHIFISFFTLKTFTGSS